VGRNIGFRAWYYFRMGWSTYFAFILAAINTLTVTYYLAIENYPTLKAIFPSFEMYIIIIISIGIPLLVTIGFVHYKRTSARKAEVDIGMETNPYQIRLLVNTELLLKLNMRLIKHMSDLQNGEKIDENNINELQKMHDEIQDFLEDRNVAKERDLDFFKKIGSSKIR
tara:strand:+ start:9557 stop:10060 length:504 start_codon:yes stop_codon:yes gene_type:complete